MNKIFIVIATIFFVISFIIIGDKLNAEKKKDEDSGVSNINSEVRAMYISYIELQEHIRDSKNNDDSKNNITEMLDNIKSLDFNWIILHVRSHSDAIYKSDIFPWSANVSGEEGKDPGYDVLQFFIDEAHKRDIKLHAWINPYRIRSYVNTETISALNPAYKMLDTRNVGVIEGRGIWYNPASGEVRELIVDGIKELILNYDIDGVHFDDYFYPDQEIDKVEYDNYKNNGGDMSVSQYRLNNVSLLIKEVYSAIKEINPNILFGIAPEGNIDNNYSSNYIDTKMMLSEIGYLDYIMPQIYYGFFNESRPFIDTVNMWNSLIKVENIELIPALAFYKVGTIDNYARSGDKEWTNSDDIIMKQILISRYMSKYNGFSIFSYNYVFEEKFTNEVTFRELNNLKKAL